jgi:hypothetical protein
MMYTELEKRQKSAKPIRACITAVGSVNLREKRSPAKRRTFLVHCFGRMACKRSSGRGRRRAGVAAGTVGIGDAGFSGA